jgi:hypothetical protein
MLRPRGLAGEQAPPQQRLVCICTSLGLYAPSFFPAEAGFDYTLTPYLEPLADLRRQFTVFSGLSHPDQSGADGHSSEQTWLTAAPHPGLAGFRNSLSLDQQVAEHWGFATRFPSLTLGTSETSQSYNRGGVMIPAESRPSRLFAKLFLTGRPDEVAAQLQGIRDGRSILDTVSDGARRIQQRTAGADRARLDEYFTAVREMEHRLAEAAAWAERPKPEVAEQPPEDVADEKDLIARMQLMVDLIPLALQTDSTRVITLLVQGRNDVPPVPGVTIDHHNLSHHGKDAEKLRQLQLVEEAQMRTFARLLSGLHARTEAGGTLLDRTHVLFGSNLGNANSHDTRNLPILLAGGSFRHGQHLQGSAENNLPLSNLFVALLQQIGLEVDSFGSSKGSGVPGLEASPNV